MDTGEVTGRQHGYANEEKTKGLYAYIAGDITKAYDSDTVSYVGRRMLTAYTGDEEFPMVFFTYDDITSKSKRSEKRFLLQITSKDAPTIDGNTVITENGEGRLVLTSLSDDVAINGVGGRNEGAYSAKLSKNYLINGKQNSTSGNADDKHWGRVEIVWTKETKDATFMNLIYVTDKGNENAPEVRKITNAEGVEGGIFNEKTVALFATFKERAKGTLKCRTYGEDSMSYYVSGVAAGSWTVSVNGNTVGTFTATDEGGLLTFQAPAGNVVITPAK
jgi:hypothetical protein